MAKNKFVSVCTTGTSILNFIALMNYIFIITKLEKKLIGDTGIDLHE